MIRTLTQRVRLAAAGMGMCLFAVVANAQDPIPAPQPLSVQASGYEGSAHAELWDDWGGSPTYSSGYGAGGCGNWFVSMNGLIFNRNDDENLLLTYQTGDGQGLLYSRNADMDWSGGLELRFGRYFHGGNSALEAVYWGIYPDRQAATVYGAGAAGLLETTLAFDSLAIDPAGVNAAVSTYFTGAEFHQIRRSYEAHNIELNLLGLACGGCGGCGGCAASSCAGGCVSGGCNSCGGGPVFTWLMGPRFLRFREDFLYASDLVDTVFTGTADELAYHIDVENNLVGFQVGGLADFCLGCRMGFHTGIKVGVYGNDINHSQHICTGDAVFAEVSDAASPFDGEVYNIHSGATDVSMIGELDLGMSYRISSCWSANVGYRAVAISGIALSTSQIPTDFFDNIAGVRNVNTSSDLILHGLYMGLNFNY